MRRPFRLVTRTMGATFITGTVIPFVEAIHTPAYEPGHAQARPRALTA